MHLIILPTLGSNFYVSKDIYFKWLKEKQTYTINIELPIRIDMDVYHLVQPSSPS